MGFLSFGVEVPDYCDGESVLPADVEVQGKAEANVS